MAYSRTVKPRSPTTSDTQKQSTHASPLDATHAGCQAGHRQRERGYVGHVADTERSPHWSHRDHQRDKESAARWEQLSGQVKGAKKSADTEGRDLHLHRADAMTEEPNNGERQHKLADEVHRRPAVAVERAPVGQTKRGDEEGPVVVSRYTECAEMLRNRNRQDPAHENEERTTND